MKSLILLFLLSVVLSAETFAQKVAGLGGELSVLSLKTNYRSWVTKTSGFDIFGGVASELDDFIPNDFEAGVKYLHTFIYNRADRTYFGLMGKWKWVNVYNSNMRENLVIPGLFIGKEWFGKRIKRKGFAIEFGYQFGSVDLVAKDPNGIINGNNVYTEFPLILNLRYSLYTKRR